MKYALVVLAAALAVTLAALGTIKNERDKLRAELAHMAAQSVIIEAQYKQKAKQINENHAKNMAAIARNYDAVASGLRDDAKKGTRHAAIIAKQCESERTRDAARMRTELLGIYAAVARYADELRVTGGACERWAE